MQDRYVGDIGDYVKLALLRELAPGNRLGVAWWRVPDESHNRDGRHAGYLDCPEQWRHLDPQLFDGLGEVVRSGRREVAALHPLLPSGSRFILDHVPVAQRHQDRPRARDQWFYGVADRLSDCDLLFLDPDNGLAPLRYSPTRKSAAKSVAMEELLALRRPGRTVVLYHHQTRRPGGHQEELVFQARRLRSAGFEKVDVLRARPFSPRLFNLLDASASVQSRAHAFSQRWRGQVTWHPHEALCFAPPAARPRSPSWSR